MERDQRLTDDGQASLLAPAPARSSRSITTARRLMRPTTMRVDSTIREAT
jgi:hypothetical protein